MGVKEEHEKGYVKGRDYAWHERKIDTVGRVVDGIHGHPRGPLRKESAEKKVGDVVIG